MKKAKKPSSYQMLKDTLEEAEAEVVTLRSELNSTNVAYMAACDENSRLERRLAGMDDVAEAAEDQRDQAEVSLRFARVAHAVELDRLRKSYESGKNWAQKVPVLVKIRRYLTNLFWGWT